MSDGDAQTTIDGFRCDLSEGRWVWIGQAEGRYYVRFHNPANTEKPDTRLVLSPEALNALTSLANAAPKLTFKFDDSVWRYVSQNVWATVADMEMRHGDGV
jgi:hypothetical protein